MRSSRKPSPQRPVVEVLEPKLLYSADLGVSAFVPPPQATLAVQAASATPALAPDANAATAVSDTSQTAQQAGQELVFIDASVPDADALVRDIQQQAANGRAIEVVVVRQDQDGIAVVTQALQDRHDISAVHLIGHGESGDMQLGATQLDTQTLLTRAADIAQWGTALSAQADLLLYGCDVAEGTAGHALVQNLAALTGADVAASDDLTGAATLGGDWTLEVQTGQIDSALALSTAMQTQYSSVLAQATPASKGTAIWTENGFTTPQQGAYDGLTLGAQSNTGITSTWTNIASAQSPTRNEAIVVGMDSSGVIRGEMWNGTSWSALPTNPLTSSATAGEQGFAVAYEQQSGNAMLVWNNGSKVSYSVYNGTTWTAAKTIDVYNGASATTIHLAAQPNGNGMAMVVTDSKQDDYAMVWDGSSWGHAITLDTSGFTYIDQHNSAVAYESQSGTVMVAYGKFAKTDVYYRTFDGTTWSAESTAGSYTESALPMELTLASDPHSDRIAMGLVTLLSSSNNNGTTTIVTQPSFSIWNGNSWGSRTVQTSYSDSSYSGMNIGVAFESLSGDVLAVYGTAASTTRYMTWNSSSGWSSVATGPNTGQPGTLALYADPYTDHIMMGVQGKGGAISYTEWTGSAFGSVNTVATNSGSSTTPAVTWMWRNDVSGNKTNTLLIGGSAAASGWSGVNNVSATEILEFADPNLQYGSATTGTFSHMVDLGALGASGLDDIIMVSRDVTLTSGLVVHRGDILFTTNASSTLSNADGSTTSAAKSDLVLYRASVAGNYSKGTFTVLVQNIAAGTLGLGTADVRGLALVEQDTVLGDVTLTQGTILFTAGTTTAAADIQRFVPNGGGLLGGLLTGNISTLITGSQIGIGQAITGLEIVTQTTPLKNMTLATGTLLITLEAADTIGSNNLSVTTADVASLTVTRTSVNTTAAATATLVMRGSSVGASGKVFDSLALSLDAMPTITSNGGGATAAVSRAENGTSVTTVTATDADSDKLTYSITGGADAALFQIDASTGALRFINAPDYEAPQDANIDNQYQVTVSASDGTYADTQAITVTVTNVNEAPVITSDGGGTSAVLSVVEGNTAVTQITSTDVDASDTPSYSISGTDAGLFDVDVSTGIVTFKVAPSYASPQDANADNIYNLTLTVTDMHGLSDSQAAYIRVTPTVVGANATPVIDSDGGGNTATVSIHEGDTAVTTVHATDADSSSLTYSIVGGADQAFFDIDPLTGALSFRTAPNGSVKADADQNNVYEVSVSASDGNTADTQDLSVTVQPYNKPPVNTLPASYDVSQNTTLPINGVAVTDADAGSNTVTVDLDVQHGVLYVLNNVSNGLNSSQIVYSNSNGHVQLTGTLAQINTTLSTDGGLLYRPTTNFVGNDTLTMTSDDGGNSGVAHTPAQTSDTDTSVIHVAAADIAPSLTTSSGTASYTENASGVVVDPGLNLSDVDTATFTTATVQITGNYVSTEDVLDFTPPSGITGITGSWNASTGTLTLTGNATPSDYQTALRSVTYRNTSDNPGTANRTVSFSISDSSSTALASRDVLVTAVDDTPTMSGTTGSSMQYTENDASTVVDPGVTLTDVDTPTYSSATVRISGNFNSAQDALSFTDQSGITGSWDSAQGILTLSGTATTADYQAAMRSIGYYNTSDAPSTLQRTVTFSVDFNGTPVSTARTITITAVDDAPTVSITHTPLNYAENEAAKQVAPSLAFYDPDTGTFSGATVRISGNYASGQDVLSFTNQSGITGSWNASTGTLTLSGTASTSAYQTALQSVRYSNSSDNPSTLQRTVTFQISDGTTTASADRLIDVTAANDAPTLVPTTGAMVYTEGAAATAIDPGITLSDPDSTTFVSASVKITGHFVSSEDVLSFTNQSGITGTWDAGTGTLTLTGNASAATYQAALRSVGYSNTSNNPDGTARTVTFSVSDGTDTGSTTRAVSLTLVNDAPVVLANSLTITQGTPATPVIQLSDVDNDPATLSISAINVTGGHFMDNRNQTAITQFTYGDVQTGHIQFVDDGSGLPPAYTLLVSDGQATATASIASVNYTPLPPPPAAPPPPPPTTTTEAPAPAPAPTPAPAPAETPTATAAPISQAPASGGAMLVFAAPVNPTFDQELRLPTPAPKPVVDVQTRTATGGSDTAAQVQATTETSFQFSWSANLQSATAAEDLRRNLDALREQLQDQGVERRHVVASSIALTTGLSVGYVIWLVRGGALIGSMLSAMPAWQMIDPLPVLTRGRGGNAGDAADGEDQSVENLFDGDDHAPAWTPEPPPDAHATAEHNAEAHP
jgi:hypothetical protein